MENINELMKRVSKKFEVSPTNDLYELIQLVQMKTDVKIEANIDET